jgi:hypothetical protein
VPTAWIYPVHKDGLFSGYIYKPSGSSKGMPLNPDQVARSYFPDPRDLRCAYSPLHAILSAVHIDDHLQDTQEDMFARGINPNLMITVGRNRGADGKLTDRRPVLTGFQRRQLIRSVREIWGNTVNRGDPAIIDGLIESVHKLQSTPQEMDFLQSGEIVKKRIFQAYSLNPIIAGEITDANRAQAIQAEKHFANDTINPIGDSFSESLTDFLGPMYESPARLLVWIEPARPKDPELELQRWETALKNNVVTRNEYRTNVLGLPPLEEVVERNALLSGTGGMQETAKILAMVGEGKVGREQAIVMLMLFLEINQEIAELMVGDFIVQQQEQIEGPEESEEPEVSEEEVRSMIENAEQKMHEKMARLGRSVLDAVSRTPAQPVQQPIMVIDSAVAGVLSQSFDVTAGVLSSGIEKIVSALDKKTRPIVNIEPAKVEMSPTFEVSAPIVHVAAPNVNVAAPEVSVTPTIDVKVPELPQPSVEFVMPPRGPKALVVEHDDGTKSVIKES